jgi:DNA-binding response OmpR family regulator
MDTDHPLATAVVFADDERSVLPVVSATLEKAGFVVLPPVTGPASLERFREAKEPMDLAVIDVAAQGFQQAEKLTRDLHEISNSVRILFLADEATAEGVETTPSLGHLRDVLKKPFRRSQLLGKALEIMDRPSALTA